MKKLFIVVIIVIDVLSAVEHINHKATVIWQDDPQNALYKISFKQALSYCNSLPHSSIHHWRLPSSKEFIDIIDVHRIPTIKSTFNYSSVGCYWTYTDKQIGSVNFQEATISNHIKDMNQECFVRCVKDK
jgi:hypothetical protein